MPPDQLRGFIKGDTFHPFVIHSASRGFFAVNDPEAFWLSPSGKTLVLLARGERIGYLDSGDITTCVRVVHKSPVRRAISFLSSRNDLTRR